MDRDLVALLGFLGMFALMALRVPIGVSMGIAGVGGFALLSGVKPALNLLANVRRLGLPVQRIRLLVMSLAGAVAAFAGGLYAHQLTYLEPAICDPMLGIHAVGYSMLGGLATPVGPLLGAMLDLGLLEATRLFEGWRMVLFGTLVAVFLRWRPRGLLDEALARRAVSAWRAVRVRRSLTSPAPGQT